jgi:hypothetical protein
MKDVQTINGQPYSFYMVFGKRPAIRDSLPPTYRVYPGNYHGARNPEGPSAEFVLGVDHLGNPAVICPDHGELEEYFSGAADAIAGHLLKYFDAYVDEWREALQQVSRKGPVSQDSPLLNVVAFYEDKGKSVDGWVLKTCENSSDIQVLQIIDDGKLREKSTRSQSQLS